MPPPPPDSIPKAAVDDLQAYTRRLVELLQICAEVRGYDGEAFLWNTRRSLEIICQVLLVVHHRKAWSESAGTLKEDSLAHLMDQLRRLGVLGREQSVLAEFAKNYGNLAVHVSGPRSPDLDASVKSVGPSLAALVRWLFEESIAASYLKRPTDLAAILTDIEAGGRTDRPPHEALLALRLQKKALDLEVKNLKAKLAEPRPPGRAGRRWPWVVSSFLLGGTLGLRPELLGGLGDQLAGMVTSEGLGASHRSEAVLTMAPPTVAPPTGAPLTETQAPVLPQVASVDRCPEGMVRVDTRVVRLGQPIPEREGWPPAAVLELAPVAVGAFCIDTRERSRRQFWQQADAWAQRDPECPWFEPGADQDEPATCVTQREAARYCAETIPGGRLPRIIEWEAARRAASELSLTATREWVEDTFPPAVLNRHDPSAPSGVGMFRQTLKQRGLDPDGNVLYSWNRQEVDKRWSNLGFRCAATLATASAATAAQAR